MKKNHGLIALMMLAMLTFSCNKEDDIVLPDLQNEAPETEDENTLPDELEAPEANAICLLHKEDRRHYGISYQYDEEDLLLRMDLHDHDDEWSAYYDFSYSAKGELSRVDYHQDRNALHEYYTYEYDQAGKMIRENAWRKRYGMDEIGLSRYSVFEYDSEGRIIKQNYFDAVEEQLEGYFTYESYDAAGNFTIRRYHNKDGIIRSTTEIEYDDKPNAYLSKRGFDEGFNVALSMPNNMIKHTTKDADGNIEEGREIVFDIDYDEDGNPIQIKVGNDIIKFEYSCK